MKLPLSAGADCMTVLGNATANAIAERRKEDAPKQKAAFALALATAALCFFFFFLVLCSLLLLLELLLRCEPLGDAGGVLPRDSAAALAGPALACEPDSPTCGNLHFLPRLQVPRFQKIHSGKEERLPELPDPEPELLRLPLLPRLPPPFPRVRPRDPPEPRDETRLCLLPLLFRFLRSLPSFPSSLSFLCLRRPRPSPLAEYA